MKFRCERDELLDAVQFVSRAISNRATLPVLSGLRIDVSEGGDVKVAATDLELTMSTGFRSAVGEPGRAVVPGRLFGDMIRSLGPGAVTLGTGDAELEIGSGRGQFRVRTLATEDYPALPVEDRGEDGDDIRLEVGGTELAGALFQVTRSASSDESRQVLTGVLWEIGPDHLTLAATDSYRLGVVEMSIRSGSSEGRRVVLPARALGELGRALSSNSGPVSVVVRPNLATFFLDTAQGGSGGPVIASRFIEGEFPNYRRLLPEGYPNRLSVEREVLAEVVKRVGLLAQNNLPVKLHLGDELEVSAHTPDVGEGQEVLDASYEGEQFVIAFNPAFLNDGLAAIHSDRITLQASDGLKPAVIRAEDSADFTYLLMPVRLS